MINTFIFTAHSITFAGKAYPAEYSINQAGVITAFIQFTDCVIRAKWTAESDDYEEVRAVVAPSA